MRILIRDEVQKCLQLVHSVGNRCLELRPATENHFRPDRLWRQEVEPVVYCTRVLFALPNGILKPMLAPKPRLRSVRTLRDPKVHLIHHDQTQPYSC